MTYDKIYKNQDNVWGEKPNNLLFLIYDSVDKTYEFLDFGCGQGRDALFMLSNGFKVTAIDKSVEGLKKIENYILNNNFSFENIKLVHADLNEYNIDKNRFIIINAFNSLQFLPKKNAIIQINNMKKFVLINGYIIISAFMTGDPLYKKTLNDKRCFFEPQELKKIFSNFKICYYNEESIFDNGHPGSPGPHKHQVVKIIAQKK